MIIYAVVALATYGLTCLGQTFFHRWLGHTRSGRWLFRNHLRFHHALYRKTLTTPRYIDEERSNTGAYSVVLAIESAIAYAVFPRDVFVVCTATMLLTYVAHIYVHVQFHITDSWLERFAWFLRLQRLHAVHHLDMSKNHAILLPAWDRVLGTYQAAGPAPATAHPVAPPATVVAGHLRHFTGDLLEFLCRCERDYGAVVPMRIYLASVFVINDPEVIADVLVRQDPKFEKGLAIQILKPMVGDGLLSANHADWRKHRVMLQPAFRRQAVERYATSMVESTRTLLDSWVPGTQRDIHADMMSLTLDIVVRSLFGADVSQRDREVVIDAAQTLQAFFGRYRWIYRFLPAAIPTPPSVLLRRSARRLDATIYAMIEARRRSGVRGDDILALLLEARDEHGAPLSDREIRDELATLFLAGTETTAGALAWSFYLLAKNPQVRDVFFDEVDRAEDLSQLPYTDKMFKEVLRLYPPSHVFGRTAIEACQLRQHRVMPDAQVLISPWAIHRSPRHYDDPLAFRPERWTPEMTAKLHRFAYLPFGGGPRSCIGGAFATTESKLILATIARRFSLDLPAGVEVRPEPAVTLRPAGGLPMIVRPRTTADR